MSYGYGAYKKTAVSTASKEQILLMLYQAAIKNCKRIIDDVVNGEYHVDNDNKHYIYEEAMKAIYGDNVFDWLNILFTSSEGGFKSITFGPRIFGVAMENRGFMALTAGINSISGLGKANS